MSSLLNDCTHNDFTRNDLYGYIRVCGQNRYDDYFPPKMPLSTCFGNKHLFMKGTETGNEDPLRKLTHLVAQNC